MQIKNKQQIIENATTELTRKARTIALNALELALNAADAKKLTTAKVSLKNSNLTSSVHPVPDEAGVAGTRVMLAIAERAEKDDLIICLISGGGSSLMPLPRDGISLTDKQKLTDALLKSGARINEIKAVRTHISNFKGGWFAT